MVAMTRDNSSPHIAPRTLSVDDAAAAIGIGRTSTWGLVKTGRLRSIKVGKSRRVPVGAIDEFIASADATPRDAA